MTRAAVGDIELEYVASGDPGDPTVVLVNGYTDQLIAWPPRFVDLLVSAGLHVVRFDNRDCGRSTHLEGTPDLISIVGGDESSAPYTLSDMAADVVGLLDALGVDRAHVAGISMGAMIAQTAVIEHPSRFLSLCSMSSTAGDPDHFAPDPAVMDAILSLGAPTRREQAADQAVEGARLAIVPGHLDEATVRQVAMDAFDRDPDPTGPLRQVAAILMAGDRSEALGGLRLPTLVVHGGDDSMIVPDGGRATAASVPGATFLLVPQMGHALIDAFAEPVAGAMVANMRRSVELRP